MLKIKKYYQGNYITKKKQLVKLISYKRDFEAKKVEGGCLEASDYNKKYKTHSEDMDYQS